MRLELAARDTELAAGAAVVRLAVVRRFVAFVQSQQPLTTASQRTPLAARTE